MGDKRVRAGRMRHVWVPVVITISVLSVGCNGPTKKPARSASSASVSGAHGGEHLPPVPAGKCWKLVWHDEFEGNRIDVAKWNVRADGPRRDGWWLPDAVELDGQGHLVMKVLDREGKFITGCIETRGKFERAHGYFVARIELQSQPGHWPAFWLMGGGVSRVGDEGRDGTEIDILEKPWLDDHVQHTLHWDGYGDDHKHAHRIVEIPDIMEGFHTFALQWTSDEYVFFIDGQETWRTNAGGVCRVPLYIKFSSEVGDWAGDIRRAKLPDAFLVDYVRVYDLVEAGTE